MFITLLLATFLISMAVATIIVIVFNKPIESILRRIVQDEISRAWARYLKFAVYVVGVSGGVRIWDLERYITQRVVNTEILQLTTERWVLEVYRTIIGTLQSVAWMLLVFFIIALIAYVIVRIGELIKTQPKTPDASQALEAK
jgi:large-conductance mechanosensitive channel